MKYSEVRPLIKTGDCLLFTGGDWHSIHGIQVMFVRMFKPSKWAHIGTAWVALDRVMILEAVGTGVRIFPLSMSLPFGWIQRPESILMSLDAIEWAFAQMGKKYPSKIKMVLNKFLGYHFNMGDTMDCSDYFTGILSQDGINFKSAIDPATIADELGVHWGPQYLITEEK